MSSDAIRTFEATERAIRPFDRAAGFAEHVVRIDTLLEESHPGDQRRKVLDFGCGNGEFLALCAAFGFDAHGVDRSSARRGNAGNLMVHAELPDAARFGPFDAITLFEVLEHLDDPASILRSLRDLLSENGILVLETPNCLGVNEISSLSDYRAIHPLDHINAFEPDTLQAFAERIGFRRVERKEVFVTADPRAALRRAAKNWLKPLIKADTRLYFRRVDTVATA
jgi:2-polyprenyl-3-methyl-5-hydroxy-6-metoxy-1,4-benzoquinol methylase